MNNKVVRAAFNDQEGLLTNVSDLMGEVRRGNVAGLFLCYQRKEEHVIHTYSFGINGERLDSFNLLLDVAKADLLSDLLQVQHSHVWGGEKE